MLPNNKTNSPSTAKIFNLWYRTFVAKEYTTHVALHIKNVPLNKPARKNHLIIPTSNFWQVIVTQKSCDNFDLIYDRRETRAIYVSVLIYYYNFRTTIILGKLNYLNIF